MKPILVSDYRLRDACALSNVKNYAAAAGLLAEYLVDHPGDVEAMFSYAVCLADLHRYGDAWNVVRELLRMAPDHVMGLNLAACLAGSQGMAFGKLARYDFRRALELAPSSPLVQWNYSLWQIQHGEWGEGWARYEWGVAAGHRPVRMHGPLWDGQTGLDGKTLFVWAEQGLGDSIMALQVLYSVAMAHPRCRIVLEVPAALVRLARESGVAARVCSPVADGSAPERLFPRFADESDPVLLPFAGMLASGAELSAVSGGRGGVGGSSAGVWRVSCGVGVGRERGPSERLEPVGSAVGVASVAR